MDVFCLCICVPLFVSSNSNSLFHYQPLFVWYETLFFLGFHAKLKEKVQQGVDEKIAIYKKSQSKKASE